MDQRSKRLRRGAAFLVILVGFALAGGAAATPASAATKPKPIYHGMGALVPTEDINARPVATAGVRTAAPPASANLVTWAPPAAHQGSIGSCVAWTIDYGMMSWYAKKQGHTGAPFAPMYTYSQIKAPGPAGGSWPTDALNVAYTQGNDTRANYWQGDYDDKTLPTAAQRANAGYHKIQGYSTLWSARTGQGQPGIDILKRELGTTGRPVAIATYLHSSFTQANVNKTTPYYTGAGTLLSGAHEMMAIGYTSWGLYVQNSWGTAFGDNGRFMMSWDIVGKEVYAAHVINGGLVGDGTGGNNSGGDATGPTVGTITQYLTPSGKIGPTVPVTVNYSATDASGVAAYNVWLQANNGTWTDITSRLSSVKSTQLKTSLTRGTSYNIAVRAKDGKGNWSGYKIQALTPKVYDNAAYTTRSTGWSTRAWSPAYGGSQVSTAKAGAWVKITYTGRSFSWVATKASNRGRAYVYVDGVYKKTIELGSSTTSARTVVYSVYSKASEKHTITIKAAGTRGRPTIDLDAFAVM